MVTTLKFSARTRIIHSTSRMHEKLLKHSAMILAPRPQQLCHDGGNVGQKKVGVEELCDGHMSMPNGFLLESGPPSHFVIKGLDGFP